MRRLLATALLMLGLLPIPALGAKPAAPRMPGQEQSYPVWRGGHASLPDHTVLRPADLRRVPYRLPIVVWANGGCRHSNEEYRYFLTTFASYGVFIVANGAPENPYVVAELAPVVTPQPKLLTDGIDWAIAQNASPRSPYYGRLDVNRILLMGQSCGGWEAADASADRRVKGTIIWNSGANPQHMTGIENLHAPLLLAYGGAFDHVAWDAEVTYRLSKVPTVLAIGEGGHTNWWDDPPAGSPRPSAQQREPLPVAANWLALTLYRSPRARAYFVGDSCGLCNRPGWTVESKNWS